ncbi:MAG TPA: hypothetical protein VM509_06455 [Planctomycetota bacterium]|nr:hypothetical protein [Planctomycetota bacterium]
MSTLLRTVVAVVPLVIGALPATALPAPQVSPDAGPNQVVLHPQSVQLAGTLNNRSILDWWTADGNNATENKIVMYSDLTGVTASPTLISTTGILFGWPSDLIWINNQLYGIESFRRFLYTVVPSTGVCTPIGPANTYQDVYSLAYDAAGDRLFGVDLLKKKLLLFNRSTGVVTPVPGSLQGHPLIRALAYNDADQMLYANDQQHDTLLRINPANSAVTVVALMPIEPFGRIEELSFFHGELYASDGLLNAAGDLIGGQLQKVNMATGATINVGPPINDVSPHSLIVNSVPEDFLWTKISGPGAVTFDNAHVLNPSVTFSVPGEYQLALTAFAYPTPIVDTVVIGSYTDGDGDGVLDPFDNCVAIANPGQEDCDGDGAGNLCEIAAGTTQDCNANGLPDECEIDAGTVPDCNANGVPDSCDLASGALDCNANGLLDTCEIAAGSALDCNENGIPDSCDLVSGASTDCNANGIPDSCDIASGFSLDCNQNGTPDACDLAAGTAQDCNSNGIPDSCDIASGALDCNANGVLDTCEIAAGSVLDCNANGIPDSCDIATGAAVDCDANGQIDACEIASGTALDCNANGIPDSCDLASGVAQDCDANGVPDSCDIASGAAFDCDANGIPDSCDIASGASLDCNVNGIPDACDLTVGSSLDSDTNAVPDECEAVNGFVFCAGDGSATLCPCGNDGGPLAGCANSTGFGARLYNSGGVSCAADDAVLTAIHLPANKLAVVITGDQTMNAGQGTPFFDGLLCLVVRRRLTPGLSSATGVVSTTNAVAGSQGLIQPGATWYFQTWYRSGLVGAPCGTAANTSNGLGIVFGP